MSSVRYTSYHRTPSVSTLRQELQVTPAIAGKVKSMLTGEMPLNTARMPVGNGSSNGLVTILLHNISGLVGAYGVCYVMSVDGVDCICQYVDVGEMSKVTLIYDEIDGHIRISRLDHYIKRLDLVGFEISKNTKK